MSSDGSAPAELPFDEVVVARAGMTARSMSSAQFLAMPLDERVKLILRREVSFLKGSTAVDRAAALRSLRSVARE